MKKTVFAVVVLALGLAQAGVFPCEPEGPLPVVKNGARVYMGGNLNKMSEYYATYLYAWIRSSSELRDFKLFKTFGVGHSYSNADGMKGVLENVRPDVVVMVLGVDALYYGTDDKWREGFRKSMARMADACKKAGVQFAIFSLPAKYGSKAEDEENRKIAVYAEDMRAFARERGLCFFDLHRASLDFQPKQTAACINDLRMARFLMDFFGIKIHNPHLNIDFAANTATLEAPNEVVSKGKGVYEITSRRPPLGFTYCGAEAAKWTGLEIRGANIPADVKTVTISWPGQNLKVAREDLEKGVNLEALRPGWTPYRNVGMRVLGSGGKANPFWNQLVLTSRLPYFENKVTAMQPGKSRTEFFNFLRDEIRAGVDRDFEAADKAVSPACNKPEVFTLTFTLVR